MNRANDLFVANVRAFTVGEAPYIDVVIEHAESGETFNGTTMSCYATRSNIGLTRDLNSIKRIQRVMPKVIGTAGDVVSIYVGTKTTPEGTTTFSGPFSFTIGTDYKIDCRVSWRWITIRMEYAGANTVRLAGYDLEFMQDGWR